MTDIQGKHAALSVQRPEEVRRIAHALASGVRLEMVRLLGTRSMNVGELAAALDIPMSTAAQGVKCLEAAGIIRCEAQPGVRGAMKLCSLRLDHVSIALGPPKRPSVSFLTMSMPVGGYSVADGIRPTCGLASEQGHIGDVDVPASFYLTDRFSAQLLWFRQGFLEYRFSVEKLAGIVPEWMEVSFEACSEAPMYRDPWKSDIAVELNGCRLGLWTCPCDCGGRHGSLTPAWWGDLSTQYGFLKTWRVDENGSYLEGDRIGDTRLADLRLGEGDFIRLRIGVPGDAQHVGGINLFGERFGDYPQALVMRIGYHVR